MEVHRSDRRIAGVVHDDDPLRRSGLCRNGVETTGERLGHIVAENKGHDLAPRPSFIAPLSWIVSGFCKLVKAPMLSVRRPFRAPGHIDGGALNDCGSSWNLAAPDMDFSSARRLGHNWRPLLTSRRGVNT